MNNTMKSGKLEKFSLFLAITPWIYAGLVIMRCPGFG